MERRYIVDTTLRDGEQSCGIAFDVDKKVKIASILDSLGVYQIEAGIPAVGKAEKEAIYKIMQNRQNAKIVAWNRMNTQDIKHSFECCPDIIHICVPVSYVQIYSKLRKNKVWLINMLIECVSFVQANGFEVAIGFEDASRADITFMLSIISTLESMGIKSVRYADTVGVLTPVRAADTVKSLMKNRNIDIEIHVHNDLGMAVANSIEACKAGAKYIDCTMFGLGERAGNCNLFHFLHATERLYNCGITTHQIGQAQKEIASVIGGL